MDVIVVAVLAVAALFKFRMARTIARSPVGATKGGRWMVRTQQLIGLALLAGAIAWLVWRRSVS